jgi:muskelin
MRGGHQMCIDSETGHVYLLGGWDGQKDLSDFWVYSIPTRNWTCLSADTSRDGAGPCARSCHKVCFDPKMKVMYVMGRYVDPDHRPNVNLENDLWRYEVDSKKWVKLSANTLVNMNYFPLYLILIIPLLLVGRRSRTYLRPSNGD